VLVFINLFTTCFPLRELCMFSSLRPWRETTSAIKSKKISTTNEPKICIDGTRMTPMQQIFEDGYP
jgi:hypothetical protein